ncbi:MAG: hypothetical protein ACI8UD_002217 [Planctomycetota bacterium]|jgi:hypothetical protein
MPNLGSALAWERNQLFASAGCCSERQRSTRSIGAAHVLAIASVVRLREGVDCRARVVARCDLGASQLS